MGFGKLRWAVLLLPYFLPLGYSSANAVETRSWDESYALAHKVVSQMTVDEKVGVLTGVTFAKSKCNGDTHPVPRLGIPALCFKDGPAGVQPSKNVTGFPAGINAASTFSRTLMRKRGEAIGRELKGKGVNTWYGPSIDIMRNPKGGRGWEAFGPDPYLNSEGGYETIMGVQGVGVQACAKHLAANNQEHNRYNLSVTLDDRAMWEVYGYPYIRSIKEADLSSVMCSFNRINGTFTCSHPKLLANDGFLRSNGFKGFVVSDYGATHGTAAEIANAGMEMEQPGEFDPLVNGGGVFTEGGLKNSVLNGTVSNERLDEMAIRVLAPWYRLRQDVDYPPINHAADVRSEEHTALAKEIASASAVLLKNAPRASNSSSSRTLGRHLGLPILKSEIKEMAIIGEDAKQPDLSLCNELVECTNGTLAVGWGSGGNSLEFLIAPADAITSYVGDFATISTSLSNDATAGAAAATDKDVAFVFVNARSGEWIQNIVHDQGGDRNDLELFYEGRQLIERVAAVCNNTVVVVHSVGPVFMPWSTHPNITAIVYAGVPGEQSGPSIVDVLYGNYNPSGRLPFSIADTEEAYGTQIVYDRTIGPLTLNYTEGLFLDYRYMEEHGISPRFEYGFGLSYTTFAYDNLDIRSNGSSKSVTFSIRNTGGVDGTEIPQLYLGFPEGSGEPKKVLRGFSDVAVKVDESKNVTMTLTELDMSIWDVTNQQWTVPPGEFTVYVGASIKDIRLTGSF
ncbi:glycosyl hydrolase 3 family protein [Pleurotus pulmonarius]